MKRGDGGVTAHSYHRVDLLEREPHDLVVKAGVDLGERETFATFQVAFFLFQSECKRLSVRRHTVAIWDSFVFCLVILHNKML